LCRGPEIAQVLLNLLVNAADAVESSTLRTVRVRTWERGGKVHLEVSDSGPGIDPAVRNRLFEAFVTTKQNGRGTGLGLSICKNIVSPTVARSPSTRNPETARGSRSRCLRAPELPALRRL